MPGRTEYGLLGPLLVRRAGRAVQVAPGKQRAVLAALLLRPGQPVGLEELTAALWGAEPPPSARQTLQNYVVRLRRALGDGGSAVIVTGPAGYRIDIRPADLDVRRFEAALAAGREQAQAGDWAKAAGTLADGLALWRGEPLAGVPSEALAAREVPRLAELRLQAIELRVEADLQLGRHAEVIAELRQLAAEQSLRERLHALLMTALYRDGQQAAALAAYHDFRHALRAGLGSEPGPELQRLQQQLLTADSGLARSAAPAARPASAPLPGGAGVRYSLPPDTLAFTGRRAELSRITTAVTSAAALAAGGVVAIRAIDGMPGVGKTALAVHAAHRLREQFPARQLFIDLHGYTPGQDPVAPEAALAGLLAAIGVNPRYLPPDIDSRAALWRDKLAGQRVLLVLDNAASSAQVAPLLPGDPGCLVLVTSRRHLADLPGAVIPVLVEVLPPDQARDMFVRLAPRAAGDAPGAVARLVELAGFLPLAISLLARMYARHAAWSLADLTAETRSRLLTLAPERDSVAAAFEVSFQHLDPALREFFCYLGLHPGTSSDAYAAAAVARITLAEAERHLDALHGEGLLTETGYRRYGMHDLIRRFAAEQAAAGTAEGRAAALGRLLGYYARAGARAEALLARHRSSAAPARIRAGAARLAPGGGLGPAEGLPSLPDDATALAWARTERPNLLACLDYAARAGLDGQVVALTAGLGALLRRDGPWAEALARHEAAAAAAGRLGDASGQAEALVSLGTHQWLASEFPAAATALDQALGLYRAGGDRAGAAVALSVLGDVRLSAGEHGVAAAVFGEALEVFRDLDDQLGEAGALRGLGIAAYIGGDCGHASGLLSRALEIYGALGDRPGSAAALHGLGISRLISADYAGAARALAGELEIYRELGDRLGQANALLGLGSVQRDTGNYEDGAKALAEARDISREFGSPTLTASAVSALGSVEYLSGDYPAAARSLTDALQMFRASGVRLGEAWSLRYLGAVRRAAGDAPAAALALGQALEICRDIGDREGHAETLNETGLLQLGRGEPGPATATFTEALELARQISTPHAEAGALAGLGRCALAAGDTAAAAGRLREARELYARIGAREASGIAAELGTLPDDVG